jgi:hypothetical protein
MKATAIAATVASLLIGAAAVQAASPAKPSKPSSYAPQPHSNRRVYGAPIQPPILKHRTSAHHSKTTKNQKPATHSARKTDGKSRKPTAKPAG